MATLLVSLAVMSVLMSAALPAWRHQAQREKEAELIFRGEQYVRAIRLWEMRNGPGSRPPTIDAMVSQRFLRKKYKDPMTADGEFQVLMMGVNMPVPPTPGPGRGATPPGGPPAGATPRGATPPGGLQIPRSGQAPVQTGAIQIIGSGQTPAQQPGIASTGFQGGRGGIIGVQSKSTETSIRVYNNATRYNQWMFVHAGAAARPGGVGSPVPGGRGGVPMPGRGGVGPDGRGTPPGGRGIGPGGRGGPGTGFPGPIPPGGRGRGQ